MFVNIFWARVALIAVGLIGAVVYYVVVEGPAPDNAIVIEFGMHPEELVGCEVEIDGGIVGTLQRHGRATRTGFGVDDGKHTVRVVHPDFRSEPRTIKSGPGGRQVMLVVDIWSETRDGRDEVVIGFQI